MSKIDLKLLVEKEGELVIMPLAGMLIICSAAEQIAPALFHSLYGSLARR